MLRLMDNVAFIATPILAALNPYFVMLGLDKAYIAIEVTSLAQLGWGNPLPFGSILNPALLCTSPPRQPPALNNEGYGHHGCRYRTLWRNRARVLRYCLIERPCLLVGTAIGALCAGLPAGIFVLKEYVAGACPAFTRRNLYRSRWVHGQTRAVRHALSPSSPSSSLSSAYRNHIIVQPQLYLE